MKNSLQLATIGTIFSHWLLLEISPIRKVPTAVKWCANSNWDKQVSQHLAAIQIFLNLPTHILTINKTFCHEMRGLPIISIYIPTLTVKSVPLDNAVPDKTINFISDILYFADFSDVWFSFLTICGYCGWIQQENCKICNRVCSGTESEEQNF